MSTLSMSVNMLRTRRRDNNVKPNRRGFRLGRLDRKSSRGMIYENEELRLRTININAEIERGQYDIKKLKRENELLKKEIWCLREEYEKLDKMLKDKDIEFSSSSTTTSSDTSSSDSEGSHSAEEETENVEKSPQPEIVRKSSLKTLNEEFDQLSVVQEESGENSEKTSNRVSTQLDDDIITADQSYPCRYPNTENSDLKCQGSGVKPRNFFPPINTSNPIQSPEINLGSNDFYQYIPNGFDPNFLCRKIVQPTDNIYQNIVWAPNTGSNGLDNIDKTSTDVLIKSDNTSFHCESPYDVSTPFRENNSCTGPNDVLLANQSYPTNFPYQQHQQNLSIHSRSTFSNGGNLEELLNDIETISQDILAMSNRSLDQEEIRTIENDAISQKSDPSPAHSNEKPFKTQLSVNLMPQPMPLLGFDKYKSIKKSFESIPTPSMENVSKSSQSLHTQSHHEDGPNYENIAQLTDPQPLNTTPPPESEDIQTVRTATSDQKNLTFAGSSKQVNPLNFFSKETNYVNADYFFQSRYNPQNYLQMQNEDNKKLEADQEIPEVTNEKNQSIFQNITNSETVSSENEEKQTKTIKEIESKPTTKPEDSILKEDETSKNTKNGKPERFSFRRKVSIHFRGKKKQQSKKLTRIPEDLILEESTKKIASPTDKKSEKYKAYALQKTASIDSKRSVEISNSTESKTFGASEKKGDKKAPRKSASTSPERKVHMSQKEQKKKKHKKSRRSTITSIDSRVARSQSQCTEKSNLGGVNSANNDRQYSYDEFMYASERDSISSCDSLKMRKMSNVSNIPLNGKIPWCACWGNGCF